MSTTTIEPLVIDPATGIREIKPTLPSLGTGQRFTSGRNVKGRFASWDAVRVTVTLRGHWYRTDDVRDGLHNDTVCRGCYHHGHFDYILDYEPCTRPATAEDVQAALSGPARHVQPGDRVRLSLPEYPGLVYGSIRSIYRGPAGTEVADIDLDNGHACLWNIELLTTA